MQGRLIINRVELENFKSYAGVKTIGPFHSSFSAVVGPNGSGKSNLLESLLFAFGKRAKKMRLNKLSELIHKSSKHPSLSHAKVTVFFDEISDSLLPVPGAAFNISRTVFRNNVTNYKVNDLDSTYEEVTLLLKNKGIDLEHNRFLILQGEVEQIALMKPKGTDEGKTGLLEYLEEIIGSDKFIGKIENTEKQLENMTDQLLVHKKITEQAGEAVSSMSKEVKSVSQFILVQKQLSQLHNLKFHIKLVKISQEFNDKDQEYVDVCKQVEKLNQELRLEKGNDLKNFDIFENKKREIFALEKELNFIEIVIREATKTDHVLNEKIKTLHQKILKDEEEKNKEILKITGIQELNQATFQTVSFLEENLKNIQKELKKIQEIFDDVNKKIMCSTEDLHKDKNRIEAEILKFRIEFNSKKSEVDNYYKIVKDIKDQKNANNQEKHTIENQLEISKRLLESLKSKILKISEELESQSKHKNMLESKICESNEKLNNLNKSLHYQKILLSDLENEGHRVENLGKLHLHLMNGKRNGLLPGFMGRLGDLGEVSRDFDIAFSSASNLFDSFVVKTVQNAQNLLDFVRKNQLGKANCIILDKLSEPPQIKFIPPAARCFRLFDLIKFLVPEARKAFYLALKDTLVAESLDECRKIAFGSSERWRVVCKSGEVFNQSGEMVGQSRPVSGKVKLSELSKAVPQDLTKDSVLAEIRALNEAKYSEESQLESLQAELATQAFKKSSLEKDLKITKSDETLALEKLESLELRFEILHNRKSEHLEIPSPGLVQSKEATLEKLSKFLTIKKEELLKIQSKIETQAGPKYSELKKNLENLEKKEEELEAELMKTEQKKLQLEKDLQRSEEKVKKSEESLQSLSKTLESVFHEKQQNEKSVFEKAGNYKELEGIVQSKKQEIDVLQKEKQRVDSKLAKIHQELNKELEKKQDLDKDLESLKDHSSALNEQIKKNRERFKEDLLPFLNDPIFQLESSVPDPSASQMEKELKDPLSDYTQSQISQLATSLSAIDDQEKIIQLSLQNMPKDLSVLERFKKKLQDLDQKTKKLSELKTQEQETKNQYLALKTERLSQFNKGFSEISKCLKEIYRLITAGGDADLEFADSTDPFTEGIIFTVRPPFKAWKKMTNLSGGEKTLSSLALVFALHIFKPNALYVMDEVDAALDFVNVGIVAHYIKKKTKNAQFVVVSLRYQMFELADQLVGIFKVDGVSGTLCISPYVFVSEQSHNLIIQQTAKNLKAFD